MNSILDSVKANLNIVSDFNAFDEQVIMFINTALATLYQIGVGEEAKQITSNEDEWDDVYQGNQLNLIQSYVYMSVRLMFDPPASSYALNNMKEEKILLEQRINNICEYGGDD